MIISKKICKVNIMPYFKKETGNLGERLAERFLRSKGYRIIGRNVSSKVGEIDILAQQKDAIVIIEVKTKSTDMFGKGYEMIDAHKRSKLIYLAKQVQSKYPDVTIRIDVISVSTESKTPEITHYENAVEDNE